MSDRDVEPGRPTSQPARPPRYLRTEYHVDPLGLDETEPRFSWLLDDSRRGARQAGYRILVASTPELLAADTGDLWDSGRVDSDAMAHVVYAGARLRAFSAATWKVRIWDGDDEATPWSEAAIFELGPLSAHDWSVPARGQAGPDEAAGFIRSGVVGDAQTSAPAPYLRRDFELPGEVRRARLYVTALGLYEVSINGRPVTDAVLRPGWTDYDRRVPYQAYDVTDLLRGGGNAIGAILGDGWYSGVILTRRQLWGDRPALLALLRVELHGSDDAVLIASDGRWRTSTGPILMSDLYNGETYDARLELPGWDAPDFDDSPWQPVEVLGPMIEALSPMSGRNASIVASQAPPIRRVEAVRPRSVTERPGAGALFDFGQNMVGRVRLSVAAPRGTEIVLRFAEMLDDDGSLHTENLDTAQATDRYICKGDGVEVYEPRFTFHGFRYLEISGAPGLDLSSVTGFVLHSDAPLTGDFTCSDELVTQLQKNIRWSQRGNWLDVPTDCPQRNERLGWTGDIQVFARTATFNMDVASFLSKYVHDLRDGQILAGVARGSYPMVIPSVIPGAGGAGWADAGVVVPWVLYERYGDLRILERHYTSMLDYVDFLERYERGRAEGVLSSLGDWLSLDAGDRGDLGGTPPDLLRDAYDVYSTGLVSRIAALLGRREDSARFAARRDRVREAFVARYVGADGNMTVATQTAYLVALHFDLLTVPAHRQAAIDGLVANIERVGHLQTGFLGTPYLLPVLSDIGRADLAYRLLQRTEYPGWLYPVTQGATTIWERWNGWTKERGFYEDRKANSFNHYAYGAVGEWLFRVVAGIDTADAGYRRMLISPELGGTLTSAQAHLDTIGGRVETAWRLDGERATLRVTIPANSSARLRLPSASVDGVTERGTRLPDVAGISDVGIRADRVECDVVAGSYEFVIDAPIVSGRGEAGTR
jgi:alpha-L-rhamnosidase